MTERARRGLWVVAGLLSWVIIVEFGPEAWIRTAFPFAILWVQASLLQAGTGPAGFAAIVIVGIDVLLLVDGRLTPPELLLRSGFVALFGASFGGIVAFETRRLRRASRREVQERLDRLMREAEDFRLIGSVLPTGPSRSPAERETLRQIGSARALERWLEGQLDLVARSVRANEAKLFAVTADGGRLVERRGGGRTEFVPEGALAAVVKTGRPMRIRSRDGARELIPGSAARSVAAVPVFYDGRLQGVLTTERSADLPFTDDDDAILFAAGLGLGHAIDAERIFVEMDRVRDDQDRILHAVRLLGEALGVDQVGQRLVEGTRAFVDSNVVAVSVRTAEGAHRIVAADAPSIVEQRLIDGELPDDGSNLIAQVHRTKTALSFVPRAGPTGPARPPPLGALGASLAALKVYPLTHRDEVLGTLLVGSTTDPRRIDRERDRQIEVLTARAAVSLANARMYDQVQRMATTDGLTGLVNHRRFQEMLRRSLERGRRLGHPVSIAFVDADHFKVINDTYGHPVGDRVLRGIAESLQGIARKTDVVARYGGEEFVILLEGSDAAGAVELAERARRGIERMRVAGDFGELKVTASIGVCAFPAGAQNREELLSRADQALYEAKRTGRNRVRCHRASRCAGPEASAKGHEGAMSPLQAQV